MDIQLSFDDGAAEDMRLAELLIKYDLQDKTTFYIPSHWEGYCRLSGREPLTPEQLRTLSDTFEIGSHTRTHPLLTRVPYRMAEYEIEVSKIELEQLLGKEITKFCYPRGYATDQIRDIVKRFYELGRNTLVGSVTKQKDPIWQNTTLHMGIPRQEYGNENWYEYGLRHLGLAASPSNGYFHAWGHSWELDKYNAWDAVERFFMELQSVGASS